jgi:rod shape-determining protein MreD
MNWPATIAMLLVGCLTAFLECVVSGPRLWLGAQVDLLPALMVYAGMSTSFVIVVGLAVLGGFSFDVLSVNPLGTSPLPLLLVGLVVFCCRHLILRDQLYAQVLLGVTASGLVPLLCLVILLGLGERPLIGWGSLWQWLLMAAGGGLLTPVCFFLLDRLQHALSYASVGNAPFRADREIKRGR